MVRRIGGKTQRAVVNQPSQDMELLRRFRAGEGRALAEVMHAYAGLARYVVASFFRGPFEQEEALQEIWLQAWSQRERLDPGRLDEFAAWFSVLARRRCIDLVRRARRREGREESRPEERLETGSPEALPQHRAAELRELEQAVEAFKERLKPDWRPFFELVFVQGEECAEASRALGLGRLRGKYLKRVLAGRARRSPALRAALDRLIAGG